MANKVTIQDIANELQLSRNTVSKAINNTGALADATREKILRKAAEMGYKQFAYLPLFQEDNREPAKPDGKREIAMLTTCFLSNSHFSSMMLDRFQSEIQHLHYCMTIHRISPAELKACSLPASVDLERTAGIICFEVFDYDYAQMLCGQGIPLLFVDTPVMDLHPPLKADRLYMDNRVEVQNVVRLMAQRGKKRIVYAGPIWHCQSFYERYMAYKSAMEWLGLCVENDFHDVVVSLKASNTLVMVEAYRLLARDMEEKGMPFPLHLGVTEAGTERMGVIKSAIGIGSLLLDGIGHERNFFFVVQHGTSLTAQLALWKYK